MGLYQLTVGQDGSYLFQIAPNLPVDQAADQAPAVEPDPAPADPVADAEPQPADPVADTPSEDPAAPAVEAEPVVVEPVFQTGPDGTQYRVGVEDSPADPLSTPPVTQGL